MLNDIKEWAIGKGEQTKELAQGIANEMQTTGVMEWSTTVWLAIAGFVILMILGSLSGRSD